MAERSELNHKEPAVLQFIQQHSRPLRFALAAAAGWALTACIPAGPKEPVLPQKVEIPATPQPREITQQQIKLACQITASPAPGEYDHFAPHGVRVEEKLVRPPVPGIRTEPINSNIVLIDRNWVEQPITTNPNYDEDFPQLSPDGQRVVFVRKGNFVLMDEETNMADHEYSGMEGIYSIKTDGTDERRLTTTESKVSEEYPTWSPDGKKIIFVRRTYGDFPRQAELLSMNSDGSDLRSLVQVTAESRQQNEFPSIFAPSYSPDGRKIAYKDWSSTYVIDADGNNNRLVSRGVSLEAPEGVDRHSFWLPDGQELVIYKQYRLTNIDLRDRKFVYNADGSAFADLTPICPPSNAMPS